MLAFATCLIGIFALLIIAELLGKYRVLRGEYHRKFLHIAAGAFIAFWPWLLDWRVIQGFGLVMFGVMVANHYSSFLNYRGRIGRASYGDMLMALAISLSAFITNNKVFFMIAILLLAISDGLAAVIGSAYGKRWSYKVLGYKKSIVGSMTFWVSAACILAIGLLGASNIFSFHQYYMLVLVLPPVLTVIENIALYGLDNLTIPIITILVLRALQA